MSTTNLRAVLEAAERKIVPYRNPNIDDARWHLNQLLEAGELGGIGQNDRIISIDIDDENVCIETYYVIRGCECGDRFEFPAYILDAEDPVAEIKRWSINEKIEESEERLATLRHSVEREEKCLAELRARLV